MHKVDNVLTHRWGPSKNNSITGATGRDRRIYSNHSPNMNPKKIWTTVQVNIYKSMHRPAIAGLTTVAEISQYIQPGSPLQYTRKMSKSKTQKNESSP